MKKGKAFSLPFFESGAGEESRTLDLYLGKVSLYQLSYSRICVRVALQAKQCKARILVIDSRRVKFFVQNPRRARIAGEGFVAETFRRSSSRNESRARTATASGSHL
jgi:hypothetical protein